MQKTSTVCGSHLPTILRTFKNQPKSGSVNIFFKCSDLEPNSGTNRFYQPERRLDEHIWTHGTQALTPGALHLPRLVQEAAS